MKPCLPALILTAVLLLAGCAVKPAAPAAAETAAPAEQTAQGGTYQLIDAQQAKTIMDEDDDALILDVRTPEEFAQAHIPGAILIPDSELANRAESELPDKDQLILVYCRSGRRSAAASKALIAMGYTNVRDFGGIASWPYETVTE